MAGEKILKLVSGKISESLTTQSGGAGSENKIPSLDSTGRLSVSMMPVGLGDEAFDLVAFEALSAGDYVNIFNDGGVAKVRKADASSPGKEANGFVLDYVAFGQVAHVYKEGANTQSTTLTPASLCYLSSTQPGKPTLVIPSTSGHIVQVLGKAISSSVLVSEPIQMPVVLA